MKHKLAMTLLLGAVSGCAAEAGRGDPMREPAVNPQLARHDVFWDEVRISADWVEGKPTLRELAESADAAVVARLSALEPGRVAMTDTPEDFYGEMLVRAEVVEPLRDSTAEETVSFSLPLFAATSVASREEILERLRPALPIDNVVLLLRQRTDEEYYTVVNEYGIWAATTRRHVDVPLSFETVGDGVFPYQREVAGLEDMGELIDSLR
jgi:hypothetical protein